MQTKSSLPKATGSQNADSLGSSRCAESCAPQHATERSPAPSIPRGAIKRFRDHLNAENAVTGALWSNKPRQGQRTRMYGDYLYAQDREKFMADLRDWLTA